MRYLRSYRSHALLMKNGYLGRRGTHVDSARTAVIADPRVRNHVGHAVVVNVVNHTYVHIRHIAVVIEMPIAPVAAVEPAAYITESIVDSAIEAYVIAPIAVVPAIMSAIEVPIRRSPERVNIWRNYPHAGNPVVTRRSIAPVAGRPDIVVAWAGRLAVFGQRRRCLRSLDHLLA
jgi:hypothetical protein